MFTNAKKILITTEKHELIVVRQAGGHRRGLQCPLCGGLTDLENLRTIVESTPDPGQEAVERIGITGEQGDKYEQ
jgi:hypothetical protein